MKKNSLWFLILLVLLGRPAGAQGPAWVEISSGLLDQNIQTLAVHPQDGKTLLAASDQRLFRSQDGGQSWKRIFSARGSDALRFAMTEESSIYLGSDKGVQVSHDSGKKWESFYTSGGNAGKVLCMARAGAKNMFYMGTMEGLYLFDAQSGRSSPVTEIARRPVHSLLIQKETGIFFAATSEGFYKQASSGAAWEKVFTLGAEAAEKTVSEEDALGQFQIEEVALPIRFPNLIHMPQEGPLYAATREGIWEGQAEGSDWTPLKGQNFPKNIRSMTRSGRTFYVATSAGIYQWNPKLGNFRELYKGIDSIQVQTVVYSEAGDYLVAGTTRGIFRLNHPELDLFPLSEANPGMQPRDIFKLFENEPTILEIQNAAIRYAEVHPDKIKNWRAAAARKALVPTLSLDGGFDKDQNVDIDRGGTADPDRFIIGPEEKGFDWSVGVNWDLGDLIWNDDQTSIDVRSKLMAELREDILSQVTHFYFERRRLQAQIILSPPADMAIEIEKTIRLEELTANIDALTGGYWTQRVQKR
ncbi:MAG: hypothetical protein HY592_05425 [Candidatus Omnitrophica bacterium]|nr:hypothetical protein [Candidatus Omnitrophota bacterium]